MHASQNFTITGLHAFGRVSHTNQPENGLKPLQTSNKITRCSSAFAIRNHFFWLICKPLCPQLWKNQGGGLRVWLKK
jgi:hypothetical protein